jgi:hypothetical protein
VLRGPAVDASQVYATSVTAWCCKAYVLAFQSLDLLYEAYGAANSGIMLL